MFVSDLFFFFFKQKTAYEMRISDWSSDVCSSDRQNIVLDRAEQSAQILVVHLDEIIEDEHLFLDRLGDGLVPFADLQIGRASCGERVCQYVWISVVGVSLKKKKKNTNREH